VLSQKGRTNSSENICDHEPLHSPEPTDEYNELRSNEKDELQVTVETLIQEKATLQEQLQALQQALESIKIRVKPIWKMNCEQVEEFDETTAAKDREIAELKLGRGHSPTPSLDGSMTELPKASSQARKEYSQERTQVFT